MHSFSSVTPDDVCCFVLLRIVVYAINFLLPLPSFQIMSQVTRGDPRNKHTLYRRSLYPLLLPYVVPFVMLPSPVTRHYTVCHFTLYSYRKLCRGSCYPLLLPDVLPCVTLPSNLTVRCAVRHVTLSCYQTFYRVSLYPLLLPYVVPCVMSPCPVTRRFTVGHFTLCSYHTLYRLSLYPLR